MNLSAEFQNTSPDHLLTCLGLAIEEAKSVKTQIKSKRVSMQVRPENPCPLILMQVNREIDYLQAKLTEVQSKVNRGIKSDS